MTNRMDSRNRSAFDIVKDLRSLGRQACRVAILGSHHVDATAVASSLDQQWSVIVEMLHFEPVRVLTGCAGVGAEKSARLVAKSVTGKLAVVFHRADVTYGSKAAERMRDILLAQESDALILLTSGKKCCRHARDRFSGFNKKVYEIECE